MKKIIVFLSAIIIVVCGCKNSENKDNRLAHSSREDKNGWVYIHTEGSPAEVGYQHGYLLATEIDSALQMLSYYLDTVTKRDWNFYRDAADRFFWNKLGKEYQEEITGIAEGLQAKGMKYDKTDIMALNGWMELAWYYVPLLDDKVKPGSGDNKAPGNCSAFIATGKYTSDGKIVMGHNAWVDYIIGQKWNIVSDIVPAKGNHIFMDSYPGFIHSGDDFMITDNGLLITETTITGFKGFDSTKTPEFVRIRKAAQYSNSIDDVMRILVEDNNGAYANDWLIGDIRNNEVMKLELGLKNYRYWRSYDTAFIGSNFPTDEKLIAEETNFAVNDSSYSSNGRKLRFEKLIEENKGKIDVEVGKQMEGDHYDAVQKADIKNRCVICGHVDQDPTGAREFSWAPFYPVGAVQGKVTTAELAKDMKFWARMGHPCGESFNATDFLTKHPEFGWQGKFLRDMPTQPRTMFEAKK